MTYRGHVENGVLVLDEPVTLPEGAKVEIALLESPEATSDDRSIPSLYERLESVTGIAEGLPADFAANHDHYAHGRPARRAFRVREFCLGSDVVIDRDSIYGERSL